MVSKGKKLLFCAFFAIALAVPLASCGSNPNSLVATKLEFSTTQVDMRVGERKSLKYVVSPAGLKDANTFWFSSNDRVVVVNQGVAVGIGPGDAVISVVTGSLSASCNIHVIDGGGGDVRSISLSQASLKLTPDSSAKLTAYPNPQTETVTWSTSDESIAYYDTGDGKVHSGSKEGSCVITASLSDGISATCNVTVSGGVIPPGPTPGGWTGSIRVGAPMGEMDFMKKLLADFNTQTQSTVTFEVVQWEEGNGADNLPQALADGPDIYPYVSDQTIAFYQRNALSTLPKSDITFIKDNMGDEALNYATLNGANKVIGYPFASDNGYVMFYSKSLANKCGIADMSKVSMKHLLDVAKDQGLEVDFPVTNAFYAAGSLMSYNDGKSLYELKMKTGGTSYTVKSTFNSPVGVKAAKQIRTLFNTEYSKTFSPTNECPGQTRKILATIVDCSKVSAFSLELGSDYGVAPLPFIDDTDESPRYANYLGYKFYGINPGKAAGHTDLANAVARFLVDEYAQQLRFNELTIKPTLKSLLAKDEVKSEPHVQALIDQDTDKAGNPQKNTIALTAVDTSLWSQAAVCIKTIKGLDPASPSYDADISNALQELDDAVYVG